MSFIIEWKGTQPHNLCVSLPRNKKKKVWPDNLLPSGSYVTGHWPITIDHWKSTDNPGKLGDNSPTTNRQRTDYSPSTSRPPTERFSLPVRKLHLPEAVRISPELSSWCRRRRAALTWSRCRPCRRFHPCRTLRRRTCCSVGRLAAQNARTVASFCQPVNVQRYDVMSCSGVVHVQICHWGIKKGGGGNSQSPFGEKLSTTRAEIRRIAPLSL